MAQKKSNEGNENKSTSRISHLRQHGTSHMSKAERAEYALETATMIKNSKDARGVGLANKQYVKNGYLDNPDANAFHIATIKHALGKMNDVTCLQSPEKMRVEIGEYFQMCLEHNVMPVIVGLINYLGISKNTWHRHRVDQNSPFFETINKATDLIHDISQSSMVAGKLNPMAYIFLAGNYFGEKDVRQINISPTETNADTFGESKEATIEAIKEQVAKESQATFVQEATFIEKE